MRARRPLSDCGLRRSGLSSRLMWCALALALLSPLQNRDHPGRVFVGGGEWVPPAQALEKGFIEYHDQWFPKTVEKDLKKWEREDAKGREWKDAYHTKSKYYRIQTNVPRWQVELRLKPFLDAFRDLRARLRRTSASPARRRATRTSIYDGFHAYSVNEPRATSRARAPTRASPSARCWSCSTRPTRASSTRPASRGAQFFVSLLLGRTRPRLSGRSRFGGCSYSRDAEITPGFISAERAWTRPSPMKSGKNLSAQELFLDVPPKSFRGSSTPWPGLRVLPHPRPGGETARATSRLVHSRTARARSPRPRSSRRRPART